jgi:hypothetical protein
VTPRPDLSDVDAALIAYLSADATLMGLLPHGVYWDLATLGATKYCLVSQLAHDDEGTIDAGIAWDRITYLVKGVIQGSSGTEVKQAAHRIYELLQDARFPITGYELTLCERTERVRYVEVEESTDVRWQHRGGQYEVWVSPRPVGLALAA